MKKFVIKMSHFFFNQNKVGFGAVIINDCGKFLAARNGLLSCLMDPTLADMDDGKYALSWLKQLQFENDGIRLFVVMVDYSQP